jgi:hypothetical protein
MSRAKCFFGKEHEAIAAYMFATSSTNLADFVAITPSS